MNDQFVGGETREFSELLDPEYATTEDHRVEQINEKSEESDVLHGNTVDSPMALQKLNGSERNIVGGFPVAAAIATLAPIIIPKLLDSVIPLAKKIVGKISNRLKSRAQNSGGAAVAEYNKINHLPKGFIKKLAMPYEREIYTKCKSGGFLGGKHFWGKVGKKAFKVASKVAKHVGPVALDILGEVGKMWLGKKLGGEKGMDYMQMVSRAAKGEKLSSSKKAAALAEKLALEKLKADREDSVTQAKWERSLVRK
jgi:hypothetical protein